MTLPEQPYVSRPIRRRRRTKAEMNAIRAAIYQALEADQPMTVRQVFYRLTSEGVIDKIEPEYQTVVRLHDDTTWRRSRIHRFTAYYGCHRCGAKFTGPHAAYVHLATVHGV
jgi:hypothetical protein